VETARRGATKTQIVYKSNLNFKLADECLARLLKSGYMRIQEGNDGRAQFSTTEKGISLLVELTRLGKALDEIMSLEGEDKQVTLVPKLSKSY
jgi:predicted transcriptional regulator